MTRSLTCAILAPADSEGQRSTTMTAVGEGLVESDGGGGHEAAPDPRDGPVTIGAGDLAQEPGLRALIGPFVAILLLAAIFRGFALTSNPPGYFEDELAGAVSAWSIVTTGEDVGHTVLPFVVTRLEVKQPLYFYATIPFQAVLGDGPLAARLPAVLFGIPRRRLSCGWGCA